MKMKTVSAAPMAALVAALAMATGQAGAASFEGATGSAANAVTDWSAGSLLAFDIDFSNGQPVTLNFRVTADDLAASQVSFNSIVRNLTGLGWAAARVDLANASFASPAGTLKTDGFQAASVVSNAHSVRATFAPALTTEFYIGNPLSVSGASDWTVSLAGRQVGDTFSVTVSVPEPGTYAMVAAGLLIAGAAARRRRQG